jgi:hypothetical protein
MEPAGEGTILGSDREGVKFIRRQVLAADFRGLAQSEPPAVAGGPLIVGYPPATTGGSDKQLIRS